MSRLCRFFLGCRWSVGAVLILSLGCHVAALSAADRIVRKVPTPLPPAERLESTEAVFSKDAPESIADLRAIEQRVTQLAKRLIPCTVGIRIGRAQGSGVIVSRDGYILTAAHVIGQPGRKATVILADGRQVVAETLGLNRGIDAGLMKITEPGDWPFVEKGEMAGVDAGDWCLAVGHPNGYQNGREPVVRLGRVVMVRKAFIQTDCPLVGGDSGGPLFDMEGRVIGINSRIGTSTVWNFHVPIAAYTDDWDRLIKAESFGDSPEQGGAVLGVLGDDHYTGRGAKVKQVLSGHAADKAGLHDGDIILEFDGRKLDDFEDLTLSVRRKSPGDEVTLSLLRDGKTVRKTVVLGGRLEESSP